MNKLEESLLPFYKFAVNHVGVGIHAVDIHGRTIIYNEKMKEIEGLDLKDVGDRTILELFNFNQQESTLLKVLQSGIPQLNVKQTYWNHNGAEISTINDTFPIFENDELLGAIELARDITALEKFIHQPLRRRNNLAMFNQLIAVSPAMQLVVSTAKKAARAKLPVLLIGETGTGKELIAESIHTELSPSSTLFYTFHCYNADIRTINRLQDDLNSSESFTVFCERIDLLPYSLQQKLLTVLTEISDGQRQFIASVGGDPVELIASNSLLKDLYYFFASFTIRIPPIRKRKEDIIPFVQSYLQLRNERYGSILKTISPDVQNLFLQYEWPGNMRELKFLLDEVTSLATLETEITVDMLPLHFRMKCEGLNEDTKQSTDFIIQTDKELVPLDRFLREAEEYYVQKALKLNDGNVTKTANALGMSRQNLQYRLRKIKNEEKA